VHETHAALIAFLGPRGRREHSKRRPHGCAADISSWQGTVLWCCRTGSGALSQVYPFSPPVRLSLFCGAFSIWTSRRRQTFRYHLQLLRHPQEQQRPVRSGALSPNFPEVKESCASLGRAIALGRYLVEIDAPMLCKERVFRTALDREAIHLLHLGYTHAGRAHE
jgi:hypothetical protein